MDASELLKHDALFHIMRAASFFPSIYGFLTFKFFLLGYLRKYTILFNNIHVQLCLTALELKRINWLMKI